MTELADYNGFDNDQRMEKFVEMKRRIKNRELAVPKGPCELCGESSGEFEYHDEDYGKPFTWVRPAAYVVCHHCHIQKIHARFRSPHRWFAFLAHVRRGGHSSDLYGDHKDLDMVREFEECCAAFKSGRPYEMPALAGREYKSVIGQEWFSSLSVDAAHMKCRPMNPAPRSHAS